MSGLPIVVRIKKFLFRKRRISAITIILPPLEELLDTTFDSL
jgi:hypothetical protein